MFFVFIMTQPVAAVQMGIGFQETRRIMLNSGGKTPPVGSELRGDVLQKRLPAFVDRADEVKILHSVPDILKRFPSGKFQGIHFLIHTQHKFYLLALKLTLPLWNAVSETERRGSGIAEIQDINQQDNTDTDLACKNRPQVYEFLHCRMQHTEQYHCKETPAKRCSQTDPALEIKFLIAVIPPFGPVIEYFHEQ